VSADVTNKIGKIPIEKGFQLMMNEEANTRNDNHSSRVVTQSAKSEQKRQRKVSIKAQSNLAQENRTSHSDEEE